MTNEDFNTDNLEPKIYVICAAAHEAGYVHGAWIKANQSQKAIYDEIWEMLDKSPMKGTQCWKDKGWTLNDWANFGNISIKREYILNIIEMAAIIEKYGELGIKIIDYHHHNINEVENAFDNEYYGEHDSKESFARYLTKNYCYEIPEYLLPYINYDKFACYLFKHENYYYINVRGKYHVFRRPPIDLKQCLCADDLKKWLN